jgi:hypothetical protein
MYILRRRFFFSWVLSSVLMFGASYLWHGLVLTDLNKLHYPVSVFLVSAGIVYFVLGFFLTRIFQSKLLYQRFAKQPFNKGLAIGSVAGVVLFLVTLVLGVSFNQPRTLEFMLIDMGWQIFEQMLGGFSVALIHAFVMDPVPFEEELDQ